MAIFNSYVSYYQRVYPIGIGWYPPFKPPGGSSGVACQLQLGFAHPSLLPATQQLSPAGLPGIPRKARLSVAGAWAWAGDNWAGEIAWLSVHGYSQFVDSDHSPYTANCSKSFEFIINQRYWTYLEPLPIKIAKNPKSLKAGLLYDPSFEGTHVKVLRFQGWLVPQAAEQCFHFTNCVAGLAKMLEIPTNVWALKGKIL